MKAPRLVIAITICSLLGSCATIKEKYQSITGSSGQTSAPAAKAGDNTDAKPAPTTKKENKPKKDKNTATTKPEASDKKSKKQPIGDELAGEWLVTSVGETEIEGEDDMPYINFDTANKLLYLYNGCNYSNGSYTLSESNELTIGLLTSTARYCANLGYDILISGVISDDATLTAEIKRIGQESYLYLRSNRGKTLMTLRRHNMEFLNGKWYVASIEGNTIDDEEANIFIDIHELKIHGNTGCNYFNGTIYIDPSRSNAIDFSNMALTRMACPKSAQETAMMVALEQTASAIAGRHEATVLFLDKDGRQLMTLRHKPVAE